MKIIKRIFSFLLLIILFSLTSCTFIEDLVSPNIQNNNTTELTPLLPSEPVEKPSIPLTPIGPSQPVEKPSIPLTPITPSTPVEKPEGNIYGDIKIEGEKATNLKNNTVVYKGYKYNQKEEVALYLVSFKELPNNYYGRTEFKNLKNQWNETNKISCTGGKFSNREGLLPAGDSYIECDIDYRGGNRNAYRIVFNKSCTKIYYTHDHYASFVRVFDGYKYDNVTMFN